MQLDLKDYKKTDSVFRRPSARAVIIRGDKIALVYSKRELRVLRLLKMSERYVDNEIRLVPYYRNDEVDNASPIEFSIEELEGVRERL